MKQIVVLMMRKHKRLKRIRMRHGNGHAKLAGFEFVIKTKYYNIWWNSKVVYFENWLNRFHCFPKPFSLSPPPPLLHPIFFFFLPQASFLDPSIQNHNKTFKMSQVMRFFLFISSRQEKKNFTPRSFSQWLCFFFSTHPGFCSGCVHKN